MSKLKNSTDDTTPVFAVFAADRNWIIPGAGLADAAAGGQVEARPQPRARLTGCQVLQLSQFSGDLDQLAGLFVNVNNLLSW